MSGESRRARRSNPIVDNKRQTYSIELDVPATVRRRGGSAAPGQEWEACFDHFRLEVMLE